MEVHNILGKGLSEIVYKDALEYEFKKNNIKFIREKEYNVTYKDIILKHNFYADFVVFDDIILEIKACEGIDKQHVKQTLNYIAIAKSKLGLVINFGAKSLQTQRVILSTNK
jgi:GxxExxY protein